MSYHWCWHDTDQSILHVTADGGNSLEDYRARYVAAQEIVQTAWHRVDVIMDAREGAPAGNPLLHLRQIISKWNDVESLGLVVVVCNCRMVLLAETEVDITSMLAGVAVPEFVRFVDSFEEALDAISADRFVKDDLPALEAQRPTGHSLQRTAESALVAAV